MSPFPSANGWMQRKSKDVRGDQQKRFDGLRIERLAIRVVQPCHRIGREVWRQWLEPDDLRSVRSRLRDVVVRGLPSSAAARSEFKQIAVQLQHEIRRELRVGEIGVDGVQDISILGDLLFRAIRRLRALGNEIPNALRWCNDALDSVRGLGALNQGVLAQRLENLGPLLLEQSLFAAVFPDQPHTLQQPLIEYLSARTPFSRDFGTN